LNAESRNVIYACSLVLSCFTLAGCGQVLSSEEQIRKFQQAGPITPEVDVDSLLSAKTHTGHYRVVPGDLLVLEMPALLRVISADIAKWFDPVAGQNALEPYAYRVADDGTITLAMVGKIKVAGKKLTEIESLIVQNFYPKYVKQLPSVVCSVKEYQTQNVTIVGGVANPGIFELRSHETSLVAALMKSGGITQKGASVITIRHAEALDVNLLPEDSSDDPNAYWVLGADDVQSGRQKTVVLPVRNMNVPFRDVPLYDGDVVEVSRLDPEVFTVLGLAMSPGAYPYPPDAKYTLAQALAFAGGTDLGLNARYVTIYRQDKDGEIVSAVFGIGKKSMATASRLKIKPGDVIHVDQTLETRTRQIFREMFSIRFNYNGQDLFD
jgi:protein involved in polysaccharide export with SLBB domain